MTDLFLIVLLLLIAGYALQYQRRRDIGPTTIWIWAWIALGAAAVLNHGYEPVAWTIALSTLCATAAPALILVGSLVYAERAVPGWILPAALGLGAFRALLFAGQWDATGRVLGMLSDPVWLLAAARVALRAGPFPSPSRTQRLLAACLGLIAAIEVLGGLTVQAGRFETEMIAVWIVLGTLTFTSQLAAVAERTRAVLSRARDDLEQRVEERTAELATTVERLEQQVRERQAAESALRESEERFRRLTELSFEGLVIHERGRIAEVNPALASLCGYAASELIGSQMGERLVAPDDRGRVGELLRSGFQGRYEATGMRRDGSTFPMEVEAREVVYQGHVLGACGVRDVSERRAAEAERQRLEIHMQEAQKLESLGVLAGGIAHDFNNLLTVVLGNSRLVLEELDPDAPARRRLERIRAASEHAASLVQQMLAYSGRSRAKRVRLDLSRTVEEMLELLRASLYEKSRFEVDLSRALPPIHGDPTQIRQVILNLVTNASESLERRPGQVRLRTFATTGEASALEDGFGAAAPPTGECVALEVSDTGSGMDSDTRSRIFEPFFTTKFDGRGLGLAAVLGIVRGHGGVIQIDSERGRGTCIRVVLPAAERELEADCEGAPVADASLRRGRILVVDDEEAVVELAQHLLGRAGFEVIPALGGRAAVEALRGRPQEIDAVVLDLVMPDLDGIETLRALKQIRADIPVILVSGYGEQMAAERFGAHGISVFLHKPYEPEELLEKLRLAMDAAGADGARVRG